MPKNDGKSLQLRLEKDNIQERKETKHTGKTKIQTCYALFSWYSGEACSYLKRKGGGDLRERGGAAERSGGGGTAIGCNVGEKNVFKAFFALCLVSLFIGS